MSQINLFCLILETEIKGHHVKVHAAMLLLFYKISYTPTYYYSLVWNKSGAWKKCDFLKKSGGIK